MCVVRSAFRLMMIQNNGVFKLLGGNIWMEPIDCMGVY